MDLLISLLFCTGLYGDSLIGKAKLTLCKYMYQTEGGGTDPESMYNHAQDH